MSNSYPITVNRGEAVAELPTGCWVIFNRTRGKLTITNAEGYDRYTSTSKEDAHRLIATLIELTDYEVCRD